MSPSVAENSFPLLLQFKLSFVTWCFWRKFSSQEYKISHSASFKCKAAEERSWKYLLKLWMTPLFKYLHLSSKYCLIHFKQVFGYSVCSIGFIGFSLCRAGWECHKHMRAMLCRTVEYNIHTINDYQKWQTCIQAITIEFLSENCQTKICTYIFSSFYWASIICNK